MITFIEIKVPIKTGLLDLSPKSAGKEPDLIQRRKGCKITWRAPSERI
jgi:hypothetical protein